MTTEIKVHDQSKPEKIGVSRRTLAVAGVVGSAAAGVALTMGGGNDTDKLTPDSPALVCVDSKKTHEFKFTPGKGTDDAIASIKSHDFKGNFMNNPCHDQNEAQVAEQLGVDASQLDDIDVQLGTVINLPNYSDPK